MPASHFGSRGKTRVARGGGKIAAKTKKGCVGVDRVCFTQIVHACTLLRGGGGGGGGAWGDYQSSGCALANRGVQVRAGGERARQGSKLPSAASGRNRLRANERTSRWQCSHPRDTLLYVTTLVSDPAQLLVVDLSGKDILALIILSTVSNQVYSTSSYYDVRALGSCWEGIWTRLAGDKPFGWCLFFLHSCIFRPFMYNLA